jgi:hypothetical protein
MPEEANTCENAEVTLVLITSSNSPKVKLWSVPAT